MPPAKTSRAVSVVAAQQSRARHAASRRRYRRSVRGGPNDAPAVSRPPVEREPPPPRARHRPAAGAGYTGDPSRRKPHALVRVHSERLARAVAVVVPPEGLARPQTAGGVSDRAGEGVSGEPAKAYRCARAGMIEKRRVAEVRNRAAPAAAPAGPVDEEAESAPAAPDAPEVEHVVAPGRGRRVQDVTKVEAHHRTAGERLSGCHSDPGTGERVEVRGQASGHRAVEELGKVARECRLQAAQMWLEPRCGGSEEESPEGDAATASAATPGRHAR